jgi:hypothetical protein
MNQDLDFSQLPLRDIHLPEPLSWWPPAPGWWLLAGGLLAALILLWLRHHRGRLQRTALEKLSGIMARLESGEEPVVCLQELSVVLRRFAMTVGPRTQAGPPEVAGLTGERWLSYLDSRWERIAFITPLGRRLLAGPYQPPQSVSTEQALELSALCADWVRAQRPEH